MTAEAAFAPPATVHPLRNRNFVVWWIGATTSLLGDQFYLVALPWVVLQLTGSAVAMGTVAMCTGIPRAALMLMGGAVTDRVSPRRVLLATATTRAVLVAAIVVGGTSLYGGRGSVARTLWGVLLLTLINNGLDLQNADADLKEITLGLVLIAAASADFFRRRLRQRRAEMAIVGGGSGDTGWKGTVKKPRSGRQLRQE